MTQTLHHAEVTYDRTTEDVGNIVDLGHVNVQVADQGVSTTFYVTGLGLTRNNATFVPGGEALSWST